MACYRRLGVIGFHLLLTLCVLSHKLHCHLFIPMMFSLQGELGLRAVGLLLVIHEMILLLPSSRHPARVRRHHQGGGHVRLFCILLSLWLQERILLARLLQLV